MSASHQIKKLFFANPVFQLKADMEGQFCENKTYYVGAKAGPSYNLSNLLHEICHFAELDVGRLAKFPISGWGLYPGRFWQIGTNWGYEQSTDQQVQREARVWAFQLSAQRHLGLEGSAEKLVQSAVYLPAFCYYKWQGGGSHSDKKALYRLANHVERLSKHNNFQKLLDDFNYRISVIVP